MIALLAAAPVPRYWPNTSTVAEPAPVESEQIDGERRRARRAQRAVNARTISAARDHG